MVTKERETTTTKIIPGVYVFKFSLCMVSKYDVTVDITTLRLLDTSDKAQP